MTTDLTNRPGSADPPIGGVSTNRGMFWRIIRRLLFAHRGRLFVILLALVAGAAIAAALLNLQVDAKRRLTSEFRAFGANVMVLPRSSQVAAGQTLDESIIESIPKSVDMSAVRRSPLLYAIASVRAVHRSEAVTSVIAGKKMGIIMIRVASAPPTPAAESHDLDPAKDSPCALGNRLAKQLRADQGDVLSIRIGNREGTCRVASLLETGGPEDSQLALPLDSAQWLANLPRRVSAIELSVPGTSRQIADYVSALQKQFPDLDVRPIRQFTEAQAKIYSRISGLLNFTVALVLVLTALCVMAAMANVAMERRNDVGLMKAIGGARRRVLRLFLTEAVLLGLIGGLLGAAAGIALSIYLGKAVFGLAARPRLIVYPVAVSLTVLVAILSAYPLRYLANVRPASVFRGEA